MSDSSRGGHSHLVGNLGWTGRLRRTAWVVALVLVVASLAADLLASLEFGIPNESEAAASASPDSSRIAASLLPSPPSAPQNLQASPGNGLVTLSWGAPSSDGGAPILLYTVYRGDTSGGESLLITVPVVTTYIDLTAVNGHTYYYQVSATNAVGQGPRSNEASTTPIPPATVPDAPQGLSATAGDQVIHLAWSAPGSNGGSMITNYMIYRGNSTGSETLLTTLGNVLSYSDPGLTNGQIYYYQTTAVNVVGEGARSAEASATPMALATTPSAPQSLQATASNAQVSLVWLAPASNGGAAVTAYKVYQGTVSGGETLRATLGIVLTYSDTGLTNGQTYYYKVSAVNSAGEGPFSNEASAMPVGAPSAPQSLRATAGNSQVTLDWQPPASNGGLPILAYLVYRGTTPGGEGGTPLATNVLTTTYTDTTVSNNRAYYYEVTALNAVGESPRSNEASATPTPPPAPPGAPQSLAATAGDGTVSLTWSPPGSDGGSPIIHYTIYRGESSGSEVLIDTIGTALMYSDGGRTNGVTYFYKVKAVNGVGEGPFSNEASAMPVGAPSAPQGLTATAGDRKVALSWSAPTSNGGSPITHYRIHRGTAPGGESFLVEIGNVLSYADTSVANGLTYYYKVSAVNSAGEGPRSTEASATPAGAPGAPLDLRATAGDTTVSLAWSPPLSPGGSPITNYLIYRGPSSGHLSLVQTVPNVLSYTDSGLTNGQLYVYQVTAKNAKGESPGSNEASATPVAGTTVPDPPRGLSAVPGDARVALTWLTPSSDGGLPITNYMIYRGISPGGESLLTTVGEVTSYSDTAVTNGVSYSYYVKAANANGMSVPSNEVTAKPVAGPSRPGAPQNPQATSGNGTITITWSAPSSDGGSTITGYTVYRGTNSGNRSFSVPLGDVRTYTDVGLSNGQSYYYVVTAVNAVGEGAPSAEVSATPATVPNAPVNLQAIPGNGNVTIQWSGPTFNGGAPVTNYRVYRGTASASVSLLATLGNVGTYSDTGLTNGQKYYYRVAAVNGVGEGPPSSEASASPTAGPSVPGVPRNLRATPASGVITLRWSAPASDGGSPVKNYTIYRGVSRDSLTVLAQASAVSLFDGGLTNGVTYYYAVAAVNGVGEGPRSAVVPATPKASGSGTDTTKPSVRIISPVAGAILVAGPTTITGNASDNVGLAKVEVSTDGLNWSMASGTATWTATLNMTVGDRTIYARATDGAGNTATATESVTVTADGGTIAAGSDLPRSLILIAVLSFVAAAGIAWFLLDRRRKGPARLWGKIRNKAGRNP